LARAASERAAGSASPQRTIWRSRPGSECDDRRDEAESEPSDSDNGAGDDGVDYGDDAGTACLDAERARHGRQMPQEIAPATLASCRRRRQVWTCLGLGSGDRSWGPRGGSGSFEGRMQRGEKCKGLQENGKCLQVTGVVSAGRRNELQVVETPRYSIPYSGVVQVAENRHAS
jgi:hypothetical protein